MSLLHEKHINSVGCHFSKEPSDKYFVIKHHSIKHFPKPLPSDLWIFMTTSKNLSSRKRTRFEDSKQWVESQGIRIPLIVEVESLVNRSHEVIYDYQNYFGITDDKVQLAAEYLRYWDIIRLCCGRQMSASWREHLTTSNSFKLKHIGNGTENHFCQHYNISEVETKLMQTYVYRHFSHIPSLQSIIGRPSNVDDDLDGTYCERCNYNIATKHLLFNDNCT